MAGIVKSDFDMFHRLLRGGLRARPRAPETDVVHTAQAQAAGAAQIVDVREPDEWAAGHIPGAIHIPLGQLMVRQQLDPQRPVITVCRSGNRSLVAADQLIASGFRDVQSLSGGMQAWTTGGQPVER
jgi:rhodanese-related sulfurtransferase